MKRAFDVAVAAIAIVVTAPAIAVLALLVRVRLGSPILFRQARLGLGGVPFDLVKFRSMTDALDDDGHLLGDAERLTDFGQRLRQWSLDELPELWLVLRGDMSLVGPRPLPTVYRDRYTADEFRRHDVKPGITGWAQVNGRNLTTWDDRLAMDVWYVDNQSVWLDLKIVVRTIGAVLRRDGINADGEVTMAELPPLDER